RPRLAGYRRHIDQRNQHGKPTPVLDQVQKEYGRISDSKAQQGFLSFDQMPFELSEKNRKYYLHTHFFTYYIIFLSIIMFFHKLDWS
ncbi:MAG: hypothetical protein RBT25_09690, partial [Lentisphaeria bacterium]|nr:hypothetical protein [Lentisphaeria bacterium]